MMKFTVVSGNTFIKRKQIDVKSNLTMKINTTSLWLHSIAAVVNHTYNIGAEGLEILSFVFITLAAGCELLQLRHKLMRHQRPPAFGIDVFTQCFYMEKFWPLRSVLLLLHFFLCEIIKKFCIQLNCLMSLTYSVRN